MTKEEAIEILVSVHYGFFMVNKRFWYEKDLREADGLAVVAASNLRHELAQEKKKALAVEPI